MKRYLGIFLFFCIYCTNLSYALDPDKPISHYMKSVWTSSDRLTLDTILDILQDRKEYIWIATYTGLVRFDGVNFRVFNKHGDEGFNSISATVLLEDKQQNIWVGTNGDGLARYKDGRFTMLTTKDGLPDDTIRSLYEDQKGNIWVGTVKGVARIDGDRIHKYTDNKTVCCGMVESIHADESGNVLVAISGNGLYVYDNNQFKRDLRFKKLDNTSVLSVFIDQLENIWIGTKNNGLFYLEKNKLVKYKKSFLAKTKTINQIYRGEKDSIWFATDSGLLRYYGQKFEPFTEKQGLNNNLVRKVITDKEKNLWIGTSRGGLAKLSEGKFTIYSKNEGLIHNKVNAVSEDLDGNIWFATDAGISLMKNSVFIKDHPVLKKLSKTRVRHISVSKSGEIWFSTYGNLGVVGYKDGKIRTFNTKDGLSKNRCRVTIEDRRGNLWVGTTNGLNRISANNIDIYSTKNGLKNNYILSIFEDSKGRLWIGTDGGGVSIIENDKIIKTYTTEDGLAANIVFRVYEDKNQVFWISTNGGLSRLEGSKIFNFGVREGLYSDTVFQVIEDDRSQFWMTSNEGIYKTNRENLDQFANGKQRSIELSLFDHSDGLKGSVTPVSWALKNKNGQLWFPTLSGIAVVDPNQVLINQKAPPTYLESILIDNVHHQADNFKSLEPDYKRIIFNFTGLSYIVPEKVMFKYILSGFDTNWSESTKVRFTTYTTLPPGDYQFKIKAANNDGLWSKEQVLTSFTQKPYFYQTAWFLLSCGIILIAIVVLFYTIRIRVMRRIQKSLEIKVSDRTREIQNTNEQLNLAFEKVKSANANITKGIRYAQMIQKSLFNGPDIFRSYFENSMVIWEPKDIVGGDFIFAETTDSGILFSVVDCTGHGVPGAFMSIIASTGLKQIIVDEKCYDPAQILNKLNHFVKKSLRQDTEKAQSDDGMDISICHYKSSTKSLVFAGAKSSLVICDSDTIKKIKGDRQSIGYKRSKLDYKYHNHEITLTSKSSIYLASDGITSQLGGTKHRIFGTKRFQSTLQKHKNLSFDVQKTNLMMMLNKYQGDNERQDDITVIGFQCK